MLKRELRLVKPNETHDMDVDQHELVDAAAEEQAVQHVNDSNITDAVDAADEVQMTPAEAEEAARFKRLAADKAARRLMLEQLMAELADLDDLSSAA